MRSFSKLLITLCLQSAVLTAAPARWAIAIDDPAKRERFLEVCAYDRMTGYLIAGRTLDPRFSAKPHPTRAEITSHCQYLASQPEIQPEATLVFYLTALAPEIKKASELYHVDPRALVGVILAENSINRSVEDVIQDRLSKIAADAGAAELIDFTIGLGQINPDVVMKYEPAAARIEGRSVRSTEDVIREIQTTHGSIYYAAAILASEQRRYRKAGIDVHGKPEILATLYNLGVRADPKKTLETGQAPRVNYLGLFVENNLPQIEEILQGLQGQTELGSMTKSYVLDTPLTLSRQPLSLYSRSITLAAGTRFSVMDGRVYTERGLAGFYPNGSYLYDLKYGNLGVSETGFGRWENCQSQTEAARCTPVLQEIFGTSAPLRIENDGTFVYPAPTLQMPVGFEGLSAGYCLDRFREIQASPNAKRWIETASAALDQCGRVLGLQEGDPNEKLFEELRARLWGIPLYLLETEHSRNGTSEIESAFRDLKEACTAQSLVVNGFASDSVEDYVDRVSECFTPSELLDFGTANSLMVAATAYTLGQTDWGKSVIATGVLETRIRDRIMSMTTEIRDDLASLNHSLTIDCLFDPLVFTRQVQALSKSGCAEVLLVNLGFTDTADPEAIHRLLPELDPSIQLFNTVLEEHENEIGVRLQGTKCEWKEATGSP